MPKLCLKLCLAGQAPPRPSVSPANNAEDGKLNKAALAAMTPQDIAKLSREEIAEAMKR